MSTNVRTAKGQSEYGMPSQRKRTGSMRQENQRPRLRATKTSVSRRYVASGYRTVGGWSYLWELRGDAGSPTVGCKSVAFTGNLIARRPGK